MIRMIMDIIKVENLNKTFKTKQKESGFLGGIKAAINPQYKIIEAVKGITFSAKKGEIIGFIGPNGAGKSTTIKMLTGILFPTSGHIEVLGKTPSVERQTLAYEIGSVFGQKSQLWFHLPPLDSYNLFARIYELDQSIYQKRLKFLIESFEIGDLLKTPVRKLSLGQRMRCEIVASLLHQPKIIFLDEPTIGLDVIAKQQIRDVIKYFNQEEDVTIFLTSHDAGDIETLAERTIVINFGEIVFDDTTDQFKKNYIKSKTIELILGKEIKNVNFPGGKIIERSKFNLKIELDTAKHSIDKLLQYATGHFDIKDINISDPSMEEIITSIYKETRYG